MVASDATISFAKKVIITSEQRKQLTAGSYRCDDGGKRNMDGSSSLSEPISMLTLRRRNTASARTGPLTT